MFSLVMRMLLADSQRWTKPLRLRATVIETGFFSPGLWRVSTSIPTVRMLWRVIGKLRCSALFCINSNLPVLCRILDI